MLREKRRYFIVVAFIIAAVLTPPDVLSQASLAIPLLALYEGSIIAVRIVEKKAAAAQAADHAAVRQPAARGQSGGVGRRLAIGRHAPRMRVSSTPRPLDSSPALWNTGSPAFAGDDGVVREQRAVADARLRNERHARHQIDPRQPRRPSTPD